MRSSQVVPVELEKISKTHFKNYVQVQMGGRANMFDVQSVAVLAGISVAVVRGVMKHYSALSSKFPEVVS
jgi:hypothetical protein